jgi:hypothetical protein
MHLPLMAPLSRDRAFELYVRRLAGLVYLGYCISGRYNRVSMPSYHCKEAL